MTNNTNTTVATILSTLSTAAAETLRSHFREEAVAEITSTLSGNIAKTTPKAAPKRTEKAEKVEKVEKRGSGRQHTNDGTERSASQFIRDCGDMSVKEVIEASTKVGLNIKESLVFNVRAQAKKKAEEAMNTEEIAKQEAERQVKDAERKATLANNAKKAREARQAKIAERKAAEENAKTK